MGPYPGYNYTTIWMTGGNGTLFALIMAAISRRRFGDEALMYYRECKTGISSTAYFCAKVLYDAFTGYLFALTYTLAVYYAAIPMQDFDKMNDMNYFIYWYWSGMALMLSVSFKTQSTVTLILVLWPMLEGLYDGSIPALTGEIKDMSGLLLAMNSCSMGRWTRQLYFCAEVDALPGHVIHFPEVKDVLINKAICTESEINGGNCD